MERNKVSRNPFNVAANIISVVKTAVLEVFPAAKNACVKIIQVNKPKTQDNEKVFVAKIIKNKTQSQSAAVAPSVGRRLEQLPSREGTSWRCISF